MVESKLNKVRRQLTFTCDGQGVMEDEVLLSSLNYMCPLKIRNFDWNIGEAVPDVPSGLEELLLLLS